ncbi:hypothetical protein KUCAC02_011713, partial [Chaenocephalus aceratus]
EEGKCEELGGQLLAPSRAVPASCIEQQQGRTITFGAQHGGGCSTWPTERGRSGEPESSQLRPHGLAWLEPSRDRRLPGCARSLVKAFSMRWLLSATDEASSLGLGLSNFVTVQLSDTIAESWHRSILIPALLFLTPVQNDPLSVDLSGLQAMHYG